MINSVSKECIELVKKFEGCRLTAYQDSVGVWTIGYGTTSAMKNITGKTITKGMKITQAQAEDWLLKGLNAKYLPKVNKYDSKYHWTQNQVDALTSFAYNIGSIDKLVANGTRTIAQISASIPAYNKAGGKVLNGLTKRRTAEKALFDRTTTITPTIPTQPTATTKVVTLPICTLKKGSKGNDVKNLQNAINIISGKQLLKVDGDYGNSTVSVVKDIQKLIGTSPDGIYGMLTRKNLIVACNGQGISVL